MPRHSLKDTIPVQVMKPYTNTAIAIADGVIMMSGITRSSVHGRSRTAGAGVESPSDLLCCIAFPQAGMNEINRGAQHVVPLLAYNYGTTGDLPRHPAATGPGCRRQGRRRRR